MPRAEQQHGDARARVKSILSNPLQVTREQVEAILWPRNCFVLACPGSGKTRTAGLRIAWNSVQPRPVVTAAVSYTNVAIAEIRAAAEMAGSPLRVPCFSGTLHAFILKYVFWPFGHIFMRCNQRPILDVDDGARIKKGPTVFLPKYDRHLNLSDFHYRTTGSLTYEISRLPKGIPLNSHEVVEIVGASAMSAKAKLFRQGLASYSDSMYICMRTLEDNTEIARAVASRFDELLVDEVQDTSDVQRRIIEVLHSTGRLKSLVLIGDLDQSIYGWQGADPEAVADLAKRLKLRSRPLTGNFRSSQVICNAASVFGSRRLPDEAKGRHKDLSHPPEIWRYPAGRPGSVVEMFQARMEDLELPVGSYRIVGRRGALVQRLNHASTSSKILAPVAVLGEAAYRYQLHEILQLDVLRRVERLLGDFAWSAPARRSWRERQMLRNCAAKLLMHLPDVEANLGEWIVAARKVLGESVSELAEPPAVEIGNHFKSKSKAGDASLLATDVFAGVGKSADHMAMTIHKVKGQAYGSILLVAEASAKWDDARDWIQHLKSGSRTEETRLAYVAITRAIGYFALAVPSSCPEEVVSEYVDVGFKPMTFVPASPAGVVQERLGA